MILNAMQHFIGYFDIGIILLFIMAIVLGIIFGFFNGVLKIANFFFALAVSWMLAKPFSKLLGLFIRKPIKGHFYSKAYNSDTLSKLEESADPDDALKKELSNYPKFIARYIRKIFKVEDGETIRSSIANSISSGITRIILIAIAFVVLLVLILITVAILKRTVVGLREEKRGFKIFDNIVGCLFNIALMFCIITIVVYVCSKIGPANRFLIRDMRIESGKGIGIGRLFYKHNLLGNVLGLFF